MKKTYAPCPFPQGATDAWAQFYNNREAIIFLVEATPTTLDPEYGTDSLGRALQSTQGSKGKHPRSKLEVCLRCAYAMMKRKVISAPKDSVGIVVFNTVSLRVLVGLVGRGRKLGCVDAALVAGWSKLGARADLLPSLQAESQAVEDTQLKNCQLVQDLLIPTAKSIKALRDLLEGAFPAPLPTFHPKLTRTRAELDKNPYLLQDKYAPKKGDIHIGDVFGIASSLFRARCVGSPFGAFQQRLIASCRVPTQSTKRIFFITDNDDPGKESEQLATAASHKRKVRPLHASSSAPRAQPHASCRTLSKWDTRSSLSLSLRRLSTTLTSTSSTACVFSLLGRSPTDPHLQNIIALGDEDEEMNIPVVHGDLNASMDMMVANLRTKEATRRTAFSVPFQLADKFTIWVNGCVPSSFF